MKKKTRSPSRYRLIRNKIREMGFRYDTNKSGRATKFFNNQLYHIQGELSGQLLHLQRWQHRIIKRVYGWVYKDTGFRIIKELYIELPRKNGKSFLGSGFALYQLFADEEMGAEVVSAAADTEQAAIVYDVAKNMVLMNPTFARLVGTPYRRSMAVFKTASSYKVISADAHTKHGKNLSAFICDELHVQPNRELIDVLVTSTSARNQPLSIYLTTAGFDRLSICYEKHLYAQKLIDGVIEDFSFYGVIFTIDEKDDWKDESSWWKANPNLGVSKKLDYLRREFKKALATPAYENTFKRLELNVWTEQAERWIPLELWDANTNAFEVDSLRGKQCYAGLDLSSTTDLCALVLFFPEWNTEEREDGSKELKLRGKVLPFFWCPNEALHKREGQDHAPYVTWRNQGFLQTTDGAVVDYDVIRTKIVELSTLYDIREIAIDRWNATQLSTQLTGEGVNVVAFGQGYASMSAPAKALTELLMLKRLAHNGHPVLRWCASNVAVEQDAAGNIKPSKRKSVERIDGMVALTMAFGRALCFVGQDFVYDSQGVTML